MVRSLVGLFLPLFCVGDLETSNDLMSAAEELMMLSRLLIMPGVEHTVQIIGVDLCLLVLKPRGSVVLLLQEEANNNVLKYKTNRNCSP